MKMRICIIISIDQRIIAPTILMVGLEQTVWQNPMDSQGPRHDYDSRYRMNLYCVEYNQEDCVISDLEKIICQRPRKKKHVTHPEEDQGTRAQFL